MRHNLELLSFQKMLVCLGLQEKRERYSDARADGPEGWLIP